MIGKKMIDEINSQINRELYSPYFYLGMSSYAAEQGLKGVASWFYVQVQEELFHAQKMYDYVNQQGARAMLDTIEKPPQVFKSIKELFEKTLSHEKQVTSYINELVDLARSEKDHATEIFLQWFVSEQVEEEASAMDILQKFNLMGDDKQGLFMIDSELGLRTFTPPQADA